ncbi:hypothetical protein HZA87_00475 [Candidatus Uhrbacteria bacterium]|nr:hypothetical protein [Candidatus Uhrbacteria bacterium]
MVQVAYTPKFVRAYKKLVPGLQIEVKQALELFADKGNHDRLRVHKLSGRMEDRYSFSVNYKIRVVFRFLPDGRALLLTVGDHSIYS